ncbi:Pectinesterase inhibitor domain [Dillenia turbinata]|uniref:Pectinesterase inhibitor domain n=1 Tax=Dillenia turbinata TaxID=194707 RepID=A0AAN8ZEW3_9MAGN
MTSTNLSFVLLIFVLCVVGVAQFAAAAAGTAGGTDYIKTSCAVTHYASLCVQSLTPYAKTIGQNQQQLAKAALSVSLAKAQSCSAFMSSVAKSKGLNSRAYQAVQDCVNQVADSVNSLSNSVQELSNASPSGSQDFSWRMSNVETWTSTALTDANTCLNGLSRQTMNANVKSMITAKVLTIAQLSSNALALVNRFAAKHSKGMKDRSRNVLLFN